MKAYSQDLRQRVLASSDAGFSQAEVAETFAISLATLKRYRHLLEERRAMFSPNRLRAALPSKAQPYRPVCSSNYKCIQMPREKSTARCGRKRPGSRSAQPLSAGHVWLLAG